MLQIVLAIILLLVPEAYAQTGVVTSMQRPGGVPQRVLDKLAALETKASAVSGLFAYIDDRDGITGTACTDTGVLPKVPTVSSLSPVTEGCTNLIRSKEGLVVSRASLNTGVNATAGTPLAKLQSWMDSYGCASATWMPCNMDNMRQAFTTRNSTAASSLLGGALPVRFFAFDGGHVLPVTSATAITTYGCAGFTNNTAVRGEVLYHNRSESTTVPGFAIALCSGGPGANGACCHY